MITQQDLQAAIAECQGQRNPNASTCIKLAAFLTIQEHMFGIKEEQIELPRYSYSNKAEDNQAIQYSGDSEFAKLVNGKDQDEVMKIIDELMDAVNVVNPRLYASVIRKLQ